MLINRMSTKATLSMRLATILLAGFSMTVVAQVTVAQVTQEGEQRVDAGAAEQKRVEAVAEQTDELLSQFKTVTKVVDGLKIYNSLLQRQVDNQEAEKLIIAESIDNVALIERQILPMMTRMLESLEVFIELDTPFLMTERRERLDRLRGMMERSDVTAAEKFRRVIEAYQIENDYGRTIEAYRGALEIEGLQREVDFLRIGRVSLTYQSVGAQYTGAWDPESRSWVEISPETYKAAVAHGIRVARKQVAPDLLIIPATAATEVGR
jgi:hypothetical protein